MENNINWHYNYVIIGGGGYYLVGYHDIMNIDGVRYFSSHKEGITSRLALALQRITFSEKVNRIISVPFSNYIFPLLFPFHFKNDKPLAFLFFGNMQFLYQNGYLEYVKNKYQDAKFILYLQDLICRNRKLNFAKIRDEFNLIVSYDQGDCNKYGLMYLPTPYSCVPIPDDNEIAPFDVFYCGHGKSRYPIVFDVYNKCKRLGLSCKFFITAVPKKERIIADDIIYDYPLSYMENLQYVAKSKCILEIMQTGADGFTPRLWESIVYDKHLLTDNTSLSQSPYYRQSSMHQISDVDNMRNWIDLPIHNSTEFKNSLSPIHLINKIDKELQRL